MNVLELFAGAGGGILGGMLIGHRCVCAVEYNAYARSVLLARQADGTFPHFPIWDDVRTFDGSKWRGFVDVVSGGFPCQDISCAGKGAGIGGERSGLWSEMARIIGEVRPRYAFIENSPMLVNRGLDRVLCDLASMGYDAEWMCLSAADCGAPHKRDRIWILGYTDNYGQTPAEIGRSIDEGGDCSKAREKQASEFARPSEQHENVAYAESQQNNGRKRGNMDDSIQCRKSIYPASFSCCEVVADTNGTQCEGRWLSSRAHKEHANISFGSWWETEPDVGRVANGVAYRVDRLKAIGNGQVPICAATAFIELQRRIK